jgi:hypothetical protein
LTLALVLTPLLLIGLLLCLFVPVMVKLLQKCHVQEISSEWLDNFSVASYYPMEGLLSKQDFTFLSRQPGFDLSLYRKLRRERLQIFKQYLNRAIVDFHRLETMIGLLVASSREDCSDVAQRLVGLRFRFFAAVLQAEMSYRLCLIGFQFLAVRSLISRMEEMSLQLNTLTARAAA